MMIVDVWPDGTLTDKIIGAYKQADDEKAIRIHEVVWTRSTNTAMFQYETDMQEDEAHGLLLGLTAHLSEKMQILHS